MSKLIPGSFDHWFYNVDNDKILWLTIDRKDAKVNSLNEAVMKEFETIVDSLANASDLKAIIITSAKKGFIAGADIEQFKTLNSAEEATQLIQYGQAVFNKLEKLKTPTIALINGFCLGGGLELALSCKYRIAEDSESTRIGLPEVKLGIHPGWGGTVRLPKLIGAPKAMDLILSGRTLRAKAAKKMGVVDAAVPKRLLLSAARAFALNPPQVKRDSIVNKLSNSTVARKALAQYLIHGQLNKKIKRSQYPAPYKVVENWSQYGVENTSKALEVEAKSIGECLVTDTSRNLVNIFFMQEKLKAMGHKVGTKPKRIHVIGAGVMGGDIAGFCAINGLEVTLQDQAPNMIGDAIKRASKLAHKKLKAKHLVTAAMDRLMPDPKGLGIAHADVIIEAITEKLEAKQGLFKMLEEKAKPEAVLATNTSTIPIEEIASILKDPTRLVGIHFFNPVAQMPLVEIVKGEQTNPIVVDNALAFVGAISRFPLPVKSAPGFLVNRILLPYMLEAMSLYEEGVPGPVIDKAAKDFGMPMGPIELGDVVGLDICLAACEKLTAHYGGTVPEKLKQLVARNDLGKKTGQGFYKYVKGKKQVEKVPSGTQIPSDLIDRLILRMFNEGVACLREGIVESEALMDAGSIFGFGFPPFRGGLMTYGKAEGFDKLLEKLHTLESKYGQRFTADKGWKKAVAAQ